MSPTLPSQPAPGIARSRAIDALLVTCAAVGLFAPGVAALRDGPARVAATAERENRRASPWPGAPQSLADAEAFPAQFETWFRDAFGGREALLRTNARLKLELFDAAPARRWRIGPNHWVFMDEHDSLANYMGLAPLGTERLEAWRACFEERRDWLAERGAQHLVVFVPHKTSVYPEELPVGLRRGGESRRAEFLRHMAARSSVRVVDLLPALLEAKAMDGEGQHVYSPHGIHWTGIGALAATGAIVRALPDVFVDAMPLALEAFDVVELDVQNDSWDRRMYLEDVIVQHEGRLVWRGGPAPRRVQPPPGSSPKERAFERAEGGPRVVVVHDSYGPGIVAQLAHHAGRIDGRWRSFFEARVIEALEPDVVIEVYSELALVSQRPVRLAALQDANDRAAFDDAELVCARLAAGRTPRFEAGLDRVAATPLEGGGWQLQVEQGVGLLRLDLERDAPPGTELVLGLTLTSPRAGGLGLYHGPEPWRLDGGIPSVDTLLPIEFAEGEQRIVAPIPASPGAHAVWLLLPPGLGPLALTQAEVRAVPRDR